MGKKQSVAQKPEMNVPFCISAQYWHRHRHSAQYNPVQLDPEPKQLNCVLFSEYYSSRLCYNAK